MGAATVTVAALSVMKVSGPVDTYAYVNTPFREQLTPAIVDERAVGLDHVLERRAAVRVSESLKGSLVEIWSRN